MRRLLVPADVPIHRPSVGAMSVASGNLMPDTFKPYVYRGTGEDTLTPFMFMAPPKPKKRKARRVPERSYWRKPRDPRPRMGRKHKYPALPDPPYAPATYSHEPDPWPWKEKIRPAPGWKPMTGADIEDLLEGLD